MKIIEDLLKKDTDTLSEHESKLILAEYGVPITREYVVGSEKEAVSAAAEIGFPVVLKGSGKGLRHKTELNLISLGMRDEKSVREAYRKLISHQGQEVREVLVQQMIGGERELLVGFTRDRQFGPCVMFGLGGIYTEILKDFTFRIAPLSRRDALDMMEDIRGREILNAFRGKQPVDRETLANILMAVGRIGTDYEQILEIDLNPLKIDNGKPVAVDALMVLNPKNERTFFSEDNRTNKAPDADGKIIPAFGEGFPPKSIAIVGVSGNDDSNVPGYTGLQLFRMHREAGFQGRLYPINRNGGEIDGVKAYTKVTSVPGPLDLVIIAVQASVVPRILEDCVSARVRNVHIITSGFGETGESDKASLENKLREIATNGRLRVIGPNGMGFHVSSANMKMFPEVELVKGPVAFVSQSGGHSLTFLSHGPTLGLGFSKVISYGNALTMDAPDFLEYLAGDPETELICMYIEDIKNGRRFFNMVKELNREKAVIIWKGGLTAAGARAAKSHTGSMAGDRHIWDAFFKQTGAIGVGSLEELVETAMTLLAIGCIRDIRAAVLGMGGGATVANGDIFASEGLVVPPLPLETLDRLSEYISLVNQGIANPLDLPGAFNPQVLPHVLEALNADPVSDIIVLSVRSDYLGGRFGDQYPVLELIECLAAFRQVHPDGKPIVVATADECYPCDADRGIQKLREADILAFPSLVRACRALRRCASYYNFFNDPYTK